MVLCALDPGREGREIAEPAGLLRELLLLGLDIGDVLVEPSKPVAVAAHAGLELVALRGQVGERGGELGEQPLGIRKRRLGGRNALIDARALLDPRLDLFLQLGVFGIEPGQRDIGVGGLLLLAGDVGGKLRQPAIELGDALFRPLFLAVEQVARIGEPLQARGGARFRLAQRRQFGGAQRLDARGFGLLAGALGHLADGEIVGVRGFRDLGVGLDPAQMEQHGLGLAHLGRDLAIADRLPRLLLQAINLAGQLADHILDAGRDWSRPP